MLKKEKKKNRIFLLQCCVRRTKVEGVRLCLGGRGGWDRESSVEKLQDKTRQDKREQEASASPQHRSEMEQLAARNRQEVAVAAVVVETHRQEVAALQHRSEMEQAAERRRQR